MPRGSLNPTAVVYTGPIAPVAFLDFKRLLVTQVSRLA